MVWLAFAYTAAIVSGVISGYALQRWLFYRGALPLWLAKPDIGVIAGGLTGALLLWV